MREFWIAVNFMWFLLLPTHAFAYDAQIQGEFEGWNGNSIYELTDGTVIKQIDGTYDYDYDYMPDIILYDCSASSCMVHVKNENVEDAQVEILSGGMSYPVPRYVPVPQPQPVAPAPTPVQRPSGEVVHTIWNMTCYAKDGSTYEVVWQGISKTLLIRKTGRTFVASYEGQAKQLTPSAFEVVAHGYGRTLTATFQGPYSALHANKNSDGSPGGSDACKVTGGSD